MKFKINDYIMYGTMGVCKVIDIEKGNDGRNNPREYYVLSLVYSKNVIIKIPVDNEKISMRKIHTRDEITSLIREMSNKEVIWIEDDRRRSEQFKAMIKTTECESLITIIRSIYLDKKKKKLEGKKVYKGDEEIMETAEKLLNEEFATVLNISPEDVVSYISSHISQ